TALPLFVDLVVAAVRAGCPVSVAVHQVAAAVPGPLSSQLASISTRASVSADPAAVWAGMATDPVCGALARAVAGALGRGVSPVATLERVASDARADARWEAEARSRSLGARAAAPLGLCFLPAFVLLGIVPLIASTATSLLPWTVGAPFRRSAYPVRSHPRRVGAAWEARLRTAAVAPAPRCRGSAPAGRRNQEVHMSKLIARFRSDEAG